jgi:hypothetical protein
MPSARLCAILRWVRSWSELPELNSTTASELVRERAVTAGLPLGVLLKSEDEQWSARFAADRAFAKVAALLKNTVTPLRIAVGIATEDRVRSMIILDSDPRRP